MEEKFGLIHSPKCFIHCERFYIYLFYVVKLQKIKLTSLFIVNDCYNIRELHIFCTNQKLKRTCTT